MPEAKPSVLEWKAEHVNLLDDSMKKLTLSLLALLSITLLGCPLVAPPLVIPEEVQAACGAFPAQNLPATVAAVIDDFNNGVPRATSFTEQFDVECRATQPDDSFIIACLFCGEAIYDFVYGPVN